MKQFIYGVPEFVYLEQKNLICHVDDVDDW